MKTTRPIRPAAWLAAALAATVAAGCGAPPRDDPAPLDRFTFPVGLAALPSGDLLVVSSNFDLEYAREDGGSVVRVDPSASPAPFRGAVRMPSYGGELAYADAAECGLPRSLALATSRSDLALHAFSLEADGTLACGEPCRYGFPNDDLYFDPYGVAVVCRPGDEPAAFVGFLRPVAPNAVLARVSLETGETFARAVGAGAPRSFAWDPERARLWFTTVGTSNVANLRWVELGGGCSYDDDCEIGGQDLFAEVRGAELQGLAFANPQPGLGSRLYVAARLFDPTLAAVIGRPGFDVGGALLVLDVSEGLAGRPELRVEAVVPVGLGASEVKVLPPRAPRACPERPEGCPRRDVVAVSAFEDGVVALYDDEVGALVKVFDRLPSTGAPLLGQRPFGLAAVDRGGGVARLYVASFGDAFVTPVDVPLDDPAAAAVVEADGRPRRIGRERP